MPATILPGIGLNYKWPLGENGWNVGMDANLFALDAFVLFSVKSATTTAPPGSPANGDRYVVPTGATGAWSGQAGKVAVYDLATTAWIFYTAKTGWEGRADDSKQKYVFSAGAWVLEGSLFGEYADDAAAASGSVPVGGYYVNSSTGALTVRLA